MFSRGQQCGLPEPRWVPYYLVLQDLAKEISRFSALMIIYELWGIQERAPCLMENSLLGFQFSKWFTQRVKVHASVLKTRVAEALADDFLADQENELSLSCILSFVVYQIAFPPSSRFEDSCLPLWNAHHRPLRSSHLSWMPNQYKVPTKISYLAREKCRPTASFWWSLLVLPMPRYLASRGCWGSFERGEAPCGETCRPPDKRQLEV